MLFFLYLRERGWNSSSMPAYSKVKPLEIDCCAAGQKFHDSLRVHRTFRLPQFHFLLQL